jgi:chemotaxis protein MotA
MHFREMTLEGILGIQAGDNPRVIAEKLMSYVPPALRPKDGESSSNDEGLKQAA